VENNNKKDRKVLFKYILGGFELQTYSLNFKTHISPAKHYTIHSNIRICVITNLKAAPTNKQ
jgi:hypothetical protein